MSSLLDKILDKVADLLISTDEFLVGLCEKFSNFTQKWIGLDSTIWGRTCIVYYLAEISFRCIMSWSWWNLLFYPITALFFLVIYRAFDLKYQELGDETVSNIFKIALRPWRFACLFCLWMDVDQSFTIGRPNGGLGYTLAMYFLAVDDLPHQPSKLRLWLESLVPSPLPNEGTARTKSGY